MKIKQLLSNIKDKTKIFFYKKNIFYKKICKGIIHTNTYMYVLYYVRGFLIIKVGR